MTEPTDASHSSTAFLPPPPGEWELSAAPKRPRVRPALPQLGLGQLGWLALAAIFTDIALRSGVSTLSAFVAVLIVSTMLLGPFTRRNPLPISLLGSAIVFACWLFVRASTWLTWLNTFAICALLFSAAATVRPISLRLGTGTITSLLGRAALSRFSFAVLRSSAAPLRLHRASPLVPILRGLLIAAIPVTVLASLLVSADNLLAGAIDWKFNPASSIGHSVLTLAALVAIAGLVSMMGEPNPHQARDWRPLGATEAVVVLGSVGALYTAFSVIQLLGALGRLDAVLDEQGGSYAEYARSGFFQLLWVAALTVLLLGAVRLLIAETTPLLDRIVRAVAAAVALLTTLIVAVAIVRLRLYTDEFGQTTLRWYCTAFAWMLGIGFVLIAAGHAQRAERHVGRALLGLVLFTLFVVNLLNPEARVAEHNLARADAAESLDADYLVGLSADAWPVLLTHDQLIADRLSSHRLSAGTQLSVACERADGDRGYGPFGFNLALARLNC